MGLIIFFFLSVCFIVWMYRSAVLVDKNNIPVSPKPKEMKHFKKLMYNTVQFRMVEYICISGILSMVSMLVAWSLWPLLFTIPVPFLGLLISEHKKYKSTGKY